MAVANPNLYLGASGAGTFTIPLGLGGMTFHSHTVRHTRRLQPRPLFQRSGVYADGQTPADVLDITVRAGVNKEYQHDVDVLMHSLWEAFGTDSFTMWFTNDDTADVLTTSNGETLGSAVDVEFVETAVPDWMTAGAYVYVQGPGANDEIVVVSSVTTGTPNYFTCDLVNNHAASGQTVFGVKVVYQDCYLVDISASAVPLGKGSIVISIRCLNGSAIGVALPS